jgi:hypothetical protein
MALAKETKAKGWWQAYGDVVPSWLDLYIGLEAAATRIDWFQSELVPGIFQIADYIRHVVRTHLPDETDSEVNRRVEVRLARQAILRRPIDPPVLRVVLRESVLLSPVGGAEVMAAQLQKLAEVSELPNVSLRVVPFSAGLYSGMLSGSFEILRFATNGHGDDSEPPTAYAELFTGAVYLDKPDEVRRYDWAFGEIWDVALDEDASRDLLRQAAEELR